MPLYAEYNKDRDGSEAERRTEMNRDTDRWMGVRVGPLEAGIKSVTHTRKVDERRKEVKEKVRRTFQMGFREAFEREPAPAYAA